MNKDIFAEALGDELLKLAGGIPVDTNKNNLGAIRRGAYVEKPTAQQMSQIFDDKEEASRQIQNQFDGLFTKAAGIPDNLKTNMTGSQTTSDVAGSYSKVTKEEANSFMQPPTPKSPSIDLPKPTNSMTPPMPAGIKQKPGTYPSKVDSPPTV